MAASPESQRDWGLRWAEGRILGSADSQAEAPEGGLRGALDPITEWAQGAHKGMNTCCISCHPGLRETGDLIYGVGPQMGRGENTRSCEVSS